MKRLIGWASGVCAAYVVAVAGLLMEGSIHCAICSAYTPDDPQWYVFFCYLASCVPTLAVFA